MSYDHHVLTGETVSVLQRRHGAGTSPFLPFEEAAPLGHLPEVP